MFASTLCYMLVQVCILSPYSVVAIVPGSPDRSVVQNLKCLIIWNWNGGSNVLAKNHGLCGISAF